jgi:hypothetical protein
MSSCDDEFERRERDTKTICKGAVGMINVQILISKEKERMFLIRINLCL